MKTPSVDKPFYSQQRSLKHQRDLAVQNSTSKFHAQIGIEICNELSNTADALPKNDRASLSAASADFAASSKPKQDRSRRKTGGVQRDGVCPPPKPALAIHNAVLERLRADVAELVDARDLKSRAATENVQHSCKTAASAPGETATNPARLQNNFEIEVVVQRDGSDQGGAPCASRLI
jgi:hypothetical protein